MKKLTLKDSLVDRVYSGTDTHSTSMHIRLEQSKYIEAETRINLVNANAKY